MQRGVIAEPGLRGRAPGIERVADASREVSDDGVDRPRRLRLGVVHDTHADLGDERARERRDLGRRDRPAMRRQRGRPLHFPETSAPPPAPRRRRGDPRGGPTRSSPSQRALDGRCSASTTGPGAVGLDREPSRRQRQRPSAQDHVADQADRAERADEQAAQVVAAHVLHRRAAGFDDPSPRRTRSEPEAGCRAPARSRDGECRCDRPPAPHRPSRRASREAPRTVRARRARHRAR